MAEEKKQGKPVEEKAAVLAPIMKSIQIALDSYDDIFSDFDTSPYSSRVLSDDFLKEIKKRYFENKKGDFEVKFTLPAAKRDTKIETVIKKRLKSFFRSESEYYEEKIAKTRKEGFYRVAIGFLLLTSEVIISLFNLTDLWIQILSVFIVPAGWYAFYSGFEHIFEEPKEFENAYLFNEKLYKAKYEFISEEEVLKSIENPEQKVGEEKKSTN